MAEQAVPSEPGRAGDYVTLAKPRLNMLVVATTLAGYYMAAPAGRGWLLLVHTLVGHRAGRQRGVGLQPAARDRVGRQDAADARAAAAERADPAAATRGRSAWRSRLPASSQLAWGVNLLAAGVALVTLLTYTVFYTPLKKRTSLATVVGGIPGALPPMIGWAAVRNNLSIEAWILFGIVFLWQMPHFLAIAWMYREDYRRAGFPLLPIVEPDGASTGRQALIYAAALLPLSLAPTAVCDGRHGVPGRRGRAGPGVPRAGRALRVAAQHARRRAGCSSGRSSTCPCCGY